RELRQRVDRGEDPQAEKDASRASAPTAITVADVLAEFMKRYVRKNGLRSADEIERTFGRLVVPRIGSKPVHMVKRSEITEMLNQIEDQHGPVMADRVLAYVRKGLRWFAVDGGEGSDDFKSPIVPGMRRSDALARARTRILADDEIRDLWAALDI